MRNPAFYYPRPPRGWTEYALGHVARIGTGSADTQDAERHGKYPFYVRSPRVERINNYTHDTEAVLTAGDGDVGEIFHLAQGKFSAHQRVYVIEPAKSIDISFLRYSMQSLFKPSLSGSTAKSTVESLRRRMLTGFHFPAPDKSAQRAIADYLDHEIAEIDALVTELLTAIDLMRERATTSRLSTLHALSATGPTRRLKHVARLRGGAGFPHDEQGNPDLEFRFFKVGNLGLTIDGTLRESDHSISRETAARLGAQVLPPGTCVMAKIGAALALKRYALLGLPSCIDNNMLGIIPERELRPQFLQSALSQINIEQYTLPGAVPSLDVASFRDARIPFPPLHEQDQIVEKLHRASTEAELAIADLTRAITLTKERRAALITAAVTGQIDVTVKHRPAAEQLENDIKELS